LTIETLVQAILAGPDVEAVPHQQALAAFGATAVPPIVEGVEATKGPPRRRLAEVISQIRDPEARPLLIGILESRNRNLRMPTIEALAHLPDPRAAAPLLEIWSWTQNSVLAQALIATGDPAVPDAFQAALRRWLAGTTDPSKAAEGMNSVAVGTLVVMIPVLSDGGRNLAFAALHAVATGASSPEVRERAILALWRSVGPGCVETIRTALTDPMPMNRQHAVFAGYFLGVGALIPDLVEIGITDVDPTVSATAREALMRIAGLELTQQAPAPAVISNWFENVGKQLDDEIAYRGGKPIHPSTVAAMIAIEPRGPWDRALEFDILTGAGLPHHSGDPMPQDEIGALAVAWAEAHADDFEPGAIYRGGQRIELP
jgi:hypothetical protein